MLTVEAMTGKAEQFFANDLSFPKERFPIVTVRNGEVQGGFMFYRNPEGTMGVYIKRINTKWVTPEALAKLVAFPFTTLGVNVVITTFSATPEMVSFCKKMGVIFPEDDSKKVIFTRTNALSACAVLRGEANE